MRTRITHYQCPARLEKQLWDTKLRFRGLGLVGAVASASDGPFVWRNAGQNCFRFATSDRRTMFGFDF